MYNFVATSLQSYTWSPSLYKIDSVLNIFYFRLEYTENTEQLTSRNTV